MPSMTSASSAFFPACFAACLALAACGDDTTGGRRVVLRTRVVAGQTTFTNAVGWSVTLTRAAVATGAMYYFDGAPIASRGPSITRFFIGVAHAHPGHYQEDNARGQMRTPWSVDLTAGPAQYPDGDGVTGAYRSARFAFHAPPAGPAAPLLAGHVVVLEGTATRGAESRAFRFEADPADAAASAAAPDIVGCRFAPADVASNGMVTVTLEPRVWLDQVDFGGLPAQEGGPVLAPRESAAFRAFARGLKSAAAVELSFQGDQP